MFDALNKLSSSISDAYERASEHGDLHLGDLHLIRLEGEHLHYINCRIDLQARLPTYN